MKTVLLVLIVVSMNGLSFRLCEQSDAKGLEITMNLCIIKHGTYYKMNVMLSIVQTINSCTKCAGRSCILLRPHTLLPLSFRVIDTLPHRLYT